MKYQHVLSIISNVRFAQLTVIPRAIPLCFQLVDDSATVQEEQIQLLYQQLNQSTVQLQPTHA